MTPAPVYLPLDAKYRPRNFDEIRGNVLTIKSLRSVLARPAKPRCFLFVGPSGCGKTTLARIVRRELGCSNADYRELDGATNRGINNVRKLKSESGFRPMNGKVKVYLIDECHMLTEEAQNAFLKTLEEGPSFCYWILGTTEPENLIGPIKTRCIIYEVQLLSIPQIKGLLADVCEAEGKKVPDKTLDEIGYICGGSSRQALKILEQVIDIDDPDEQFDSVKETAGAEFQTIQLCRAMVKGDSWDHVRDLLRGIRQEPESTRRQVTAYLNTVILNEVNSNKVQRVAELSQFFLDSMMYSGKLGLTLACFAATNVAR